MSIFNIEKANIAMRIITNQEYDCLVEATGGSNNLMHWDWMYSWVNDEYKKYGLTAAYRAYRGYDSARFWSYTSASFRSVRLGFRPAFDLDAETLPSDIQDGEAVIVGTLYMDGVPVLVPQKPTWNGDITDYIPDAKLEMRPALDDPDYQVRAVKLHDGVFAADRNLLKCISYMDIASAIFYQEKLLSDSDSVEFPVSITIRKRPGETAEDVQRRLASLLSSELENLADHDITCRIDRGCRRLHP